MKTVYGSIDKVANLWADGSQNEARNSKNSFSFHGDTIWSYETEIAKKIGDVVLFNRDKYSVTTCKHQLTILKSLNFGRNIKIIKCTKLRFYKQGENEHKANFKNWENEAKAINCKLAKAKKPSIYISQLNELKSEILAYCDLFNIEMPKDLFNLVTK